MGCIGTGRCLRNIRYSVTCSPQSNSSVLLAYLAGLDIKPVEALFARDVAEQTANGATLGTWFLALGLCGDSCLVERAVVWAAGDVVARGAA